MKLEVIDTKDLKFLKIFMKSPLFLVKIRYNKHIIFFEKLFKNIFKNFKSLEVGHIKH